MTPATPQTLIRFQDRLVRLLGNSVEGRPALVTAMLRRDVNEATSYWLQLVVSVGIATLGLVVGSTAVVIGAMLVAPLMGPIVGLAMGLASGSPFLVLRSAGRIALSMAVAVGGAALITLLLPFHQLNDEISARTSPTLLDLVTAAFCALAGVYASLRPGSDTATTAAGTSISISLVPPLCASGYGLGTATGAVAGGAALLFLTNLVAIVVVGTVSFLAAGFNRVNVAVLEREELERGGVGAPIARRLAARLATLFESRWGPVMRFLMPFTLLAAVYLPLRQALDEVAWQVRVRTAVQAVLQRQPVRMVQTRVLVERRTVKVGLVILGKATDAERVRARILEELRGASDVEPSVEVAAIPDAAAFAGLESSLRAPRLIDTAPPPPAPDENAQLAAVRARVRGAAEAMWPAASAGKALVVELGMAESEPLRVRIVHLGAPLGNDAREAFERSLAAELAHPVALVDAAVPATTLDRSAGDLAFVAEVASGVRTTAELPEVSVCVERPGPPEKGRRVSPADQALGSSLEQALSAHGRVTVGAAGPFRVRFVLGDCPLPPPTPEDGSGAASP